MTSCFSRGGVGQALRPRKSGIWTSIFFKRHLYLKMHISQKFTLAVVPLFETTPIQPFFWPQSRLPLTKTKKMSAPQRWAPEILSFSTSQLCPGRWGKETVGAIQATQHRAKKILAIIYRKLLKLSRSFYFFLFCPFCPMHRPLCIVHGVWMASSNRDHLSFGSLR